VPSLQVGRYETDMQSITRGGLCLLLALVSGALRLAAAKTATIQGTITDETGKPIRGATIAASRGDELVARFSTDDGKYDITLEDGTYDLTVQAYGNTSKDEKKDIVQKNETNFTLTPRFNLSQLSSAEIQQLLPAGQETRLLASECIRCHGFSNPARAGSMSASGWEQFLSRMTDGRHWNNPYSTGEVIGLPPPPDYKERLPVLSTMLEKYFGPDSPYFGSDSARPTIDEIKHVPLTEDVLRATVHEFKIPTEDVGADSILTDDSGNAWFRETQESGNKIGKFDPAARKFTEYPLPIPDARPNSVVMGKDGLVWIPLTARKIRATLASLDPRTGEVITYDFPGNNDRPHTTSIDQDGNIWMSGTGLLTFDVKTHQFKQYKLPIPSGTGSSDNTWQGWHNLPGERLLSTKLFST
jgi:hypothetical protein